MVLQHQGLTALFRQSVYRFISLLPLGVPSHFGSPFHLADREMLGMGRLRKVIEVPKPVKRREIIFFLDAVISDQRLSGHSVALCIVTRAIAS